MNLKNYCCTLIFFVVLCIPVSVFCAFSFEHYIACAASDMMHVFSLLKVLSIL